MYINTVKSVNAVNYYLYKSYRNEKGQTRSRIVEKLGNVDEIKSKFNVTDVDAWCKEYAKQRTAEAKKASLKNNRKVTVVFEENKDKSPNSAIFNAGYFILDSVYHSFGLSNICEEIRLKHSHVKGSVIVQLVCDVFLTLRYTSHFFFKDMRERGEKETFL